ncbi:AEC family transporter [Hyphomonas oceanitis]|uniref:Auxin efflux carrier family protein n=1 Tax=Hyphomonas oceanitis SCH89 TaxID=1280953 RepID=A0A059G7D4_9PROT|nr:AEC family transporter [Hyphomonas oceanitis]KDA02644.1 auxin efflux carrier family protein [Hyphomonas oceanitis SCH89]
MTSFIFALLPVIIIVAIGRLIAAKNWITPEGWRAIERISYILLFPALIIRSLGNAPFDTAPWKLAAALIIAQLVLAAIGFGARLWPGMERPAVGSIIQSNVRWNTFVALSLGSILFGDEGLALVTIAAAAMIPTANVLSVYGLILNAEHAPGTKPRPFRALMTNPLIIACVIGGIVAATHFQSPKVLDDTLRILGQGTIALGLLSAGAGVDLAALRRAGVRTFTWALVRLLGLPAAALAAGLAIGLSGTPLAIMLICASVPTATNGYILARQLGGDGPLSANLIAVETVLAMITLPLIWFTAIHFGLA